MADQVALIVCVDFVSFLWCLNDKIIPTNIRKRKRIDRYATLKPQNVFSNREDRA